jgi:beta-galactosidase
MQRRDFLKTTGTLVAGATLARPALAADAKSSDASGRTILPINRNWRYSKTFSEAAVAPDFNDSSFERVVIPHANIKLPWHSFDDKLCRHRNAASASSWISRA